MTKNKKMKFFLKEKSPLIIGGILGLVLVFLIIGALALRTKESAKEKKSLLEKQEEVIKNQLNEIEQLRGKKAKQAESEERINQSLKEIDILREKTERNKPLTEEEIKQQLQALDALRNQQKNF